MAMEYRACVKGARSTIPAVTYQGGWYDASLPAYTIDLSYGSITNTRLCTLRMIARTSPTNFTPKYAHTNTKSVIKPLRTFASRSRFCFIRIVFNCFSRLYMRCKATTHRIWCNSLSNLIISCGFLSSVRCRFCNKAVNIERVTTDDVPSSSSSSSSHALLPLRMYPLSFTFSSSSSSSSFVCASLNTSEVDASLASSLRR